MITARAALEATLCDYAGRRHCVLVGRGATAIYLALKALPHSGGQVVLPSVLCPSPANAALYAGFEPLFCDVELADFNLSARTLEQVLDTAEDAVAVVAAHLYGHPANIDEIQAVCRERGLFLIEDAAQALGGYHREHPLGGFGDLSVLSFGHTKILDAGLGGAVLTDDTSLAERLHEHARRLSPRPPHWARLTAEYREVYYALQSASRTQPGAERVFTCLPELYRELYLFRLEPEDVARIRRCWPRLASNVRSRRTNAAEYRSRLTHPRIRHPVLKAGSVPWRYSILLADGLQERVTHALRAAGLDASNWYPPLHRRYSSGRAQDPKLFPHAESVGSQVLNLWVEPTISSDYISRVSDTVLRTIAKEASS